MNTITVQTLFTLDHVVSQGNTTANTVQFTNATTALTATGNVEVGGELSVSGDVEVGTANLFVDTTTSNVGIRTNNPQAPLHVNATSAIIIPSGTTAQQPTGVAGMLRFNTTLNRLQVHDGSNWLSIGTISATGGTETTYSGYKIHTFTSDGTLTVYSGGVIEYLMVGGGGGGGSGSSSSSTRGTGGGGGGGMLEGSFYISTGTHNITIGVGGAGATGSLQIGTDGTDSVFNNQTAYGGGGGAPQNTQGNSGGSGGGNGNLKTTSGGSGTSGQGNDGGSASGGVGGGGGGGGAGGPGGDGYDDNSEGDTGYGAAGDGKSSSINGTPVTYATGGRGGGRGNGLTTPNPQKATSGIDGRGEGGKGAQGGLNGQGGDGGDGIVIIRYLI